MKSRLPVLATEHLVSESSHMDLRMAHFCPFASVIAPSFAQIAVSSLCFRIYCKRVITPFINSFARQSKLF